jgi:hypothetical protein
MTLTPQQWSFRIHACPDDPILTRECPWDKFDAQEWCYLLSAHPLLMSRCDLQWKDFGYVQQHSLTGYQPQFKFKKIGTLLPLPAHPRNRFIQSSSYTHIVMFNLPLAGN